MRQDGGKSISGYVELDQAADNVRLGVLEPTRVKSLMPWTSVLRCLVSALIGIGNFQGEAAPAGDYIFRLT